MDAMKDALKRKMMTAKQGGPVIDQEVAGKKIEGDAIDTTRIQQENEMAPEVEDEAQGEDEQAEMNVETEENALLKQILAALSDRGMTGARAPSGLAERAAIGAKAKLGMMNKA